jgi:hypothetical protein
MVKEVREMAVRIPVHPRYGELDPHYGSLAYMAYRDAAGGRSLVTGADLPLWEDLSEQIQEAWLSSAFAVLTHGTPQ